MTLIQSNGIQSLTLIPSFSNNNIQERIKERENRDTKLSSDMKEGDLFNARRVDSSNLNIRSGKATPWDNKHSIRPRTSS